MMRPSYRAAIRWLAMNDDNEWVALGQEVEACMTPSVAACLAADLFGVDTERVRADIARSLAKDGA